jgi:hypothetical protein
VYEMETKKRSIDLSLIAMTHNIIELANVDNSITATAEINNSDIIRTHTTFQKTDSVMDSHHTYHCYLTDFLNIVSHKFIYDFDVFRV